MGSSFCSNVRRFFFFSAAVVAALAGGVLSTNITEILAHDPNYSTFNKYLTDTKLCDEINSRNTLTVLALDNAAMASLTAGKSLSVIKNVLSLHVLLDYFDPTKLHGVSNGTTLTTTLYQTTGDAPGNLGFVNITDLPGGKVGFGSAAPDSKLDSFYVKSVKQVPFNVSVLEISTPILAPGILTAPAPSPSDVNITGILVKAGCRTFADLLVSTGVLKTYQAAVAKGLTIFAPNDDAFQATDLPDLSKLSDAERIKVLEYHASASYIPKGTLKTSKSFSTLASNGAGNYTLKPSADGDAVSLATGVDTSRVADTALDMPPLSILTIDSLLLPSELFSNPPAPAPAPSPASVPSPAPATSPTPSPSSAPSPSRSSPPAPPPGKSSDGPSSDSPVGSEKSTSKNGAVYASASAALPMVVVATAVCALFF